MYINFFNLIYSQILMGSRYQKQKGNFTLVSLDESFFFYDSLVRRVWIDAKKRPVARIIGSHEISCLFGAVSMDQKQLFRQYAKFNTQTFLDFLKIIHSKFPKGYLQSFPKVIYSWTKHHHITNPDGSKSTWKRTKILLFRYTYQQRHLSL
jgi:hypothetical protein